VVLGVLRLLPQERLRLLGHEPELGVTRQPLERSGVVESEVDLPDLQVGHEDSVARRGEMGRALPVGRRDECNPDPILDMRRVNLTVVK
jgi:hypothetical protein